MSQPDVPTGQSEPAAEIAFPHRWSERKQHARETALRFPQPAEPAHTALPASTDSEMPPLESLNETSDYSLFFSPQVSPELRRQALQKLFHSPGFKSGDGLSDYSEDYTCFEPMGELITQEWRHRRQVEAARLGVGLLPDGATTPAEPLLSQADTSDLPVNGAERAE